MSLLKKQTCSGCGRVITPVEDAVNFPCPECGDVMIWRCERCRDMGKSYTCLKCDFVGP
ncbi:MAG: zinc finger domain-containing protein [Promethearchaeia archaeon]